jgi:hypothetical protein
MTTKNTGHDDPTDPSTDSGQAPATGLTGSPQVESLLRQDSGGQAGQALRQRAERKPGEKPPGWRASWQMYGEGCKGPYTA